jgi:hypothetical protein
MIFAIFDVIRPINLQWVLKLIIIECIIYVSDYQTTVSSSVWNLIYFVWYCFLFMQRSTHATLAVRIVALDRVTRVHRRTQTPVTSTSGMWPRTSSCSAASGVSASLCRAHQVPSGIRRYWHAHKWQSLLKELLRKNTHEVSHFGTDKACCV